ncbi:MAG: ribosome small subunit-dependent GTPase A [Paludibacteraceae bacterium]|nr:ribosome small subunit-dependent GTPase A [Paludibacteraceae bacterium]
MVHLRKLEPSDLPYLYLWENDASVWADGSNHNPLSQQDLRDYIASTTGDIYRDGQLRLIIESVSPQDGLSAQRSVSETVCQRSGLLRKLQGRVTLFSGNSGVGKSTLLNAMFGQEMTRTGKISDAHDKGMHTTTFSEMYFLEDGAIIDTPGIKGFGTIDFEKEEVSHYFPELFQAGRDCRFGNCTHTHEPGCAVQEKIITGDIAISRYESYLSLLGDCDESKYR